MHTCYISICLFYSFFLNFLVRFQSNTDGGKKVKLISTNTAFFLGKLAKRTCTSGPPRSHFTENYLQHERRQEYIKIPHTFSSSTFFLQVNFHEIFVINKVLITYVFSRILNLPISDFFFRFLIFFLLKPTVIMAFFSYLDLNKKILWKN